MESNQKPRWEGRVTVHLPGSTADQVWPLLEDFTSVHKWLPSIDTCRNVEGVPGEPGCVRYCAGSSLPSDGGGGEEGETSTITTTWAKEKLLSKDPIGRSLSYEVIDSNVGFGWYVGTFKVSAGTDGGDGCLIEWSFVADPVDGWSVEVLVSYMDVSLKAMGKRMEEALQAGG